MNRTGAEGQRRQHGETGFSRGRIHAEMPVQELDDGPTSVDDEGVTCHHAGRFGSEEDHRS